MGEDEVSRPEGCQGNEDNEPCGEAVHTQILYDSSYPVHVLYKSNAVLRPPDQRCRLTIRPSAYHSSTIKAVLSQDT